MEAALDVFQQIGNTLNKACSGTAPEQVIFFLMLLYLYMPFGIGVSIHWPNIHIIVETFAPGY